MAKTPHAGREGDKHMIRPLARDKSIPDALRQGLSRCVVTALLAAAQVGGLYGPWALGAVAVSGGRGGSLWALLGAIMGALVFFDFQTGLRFAASAVLICCANMAFCDAKLSVRRGYAPALAAVALGLVQSVYLVGRDAAQWALGAAAAAVAAAAAWAFALEEGGQRRGTLGLLTAAVAALSSIRVEGYSPGMMAAAWLALLCTSGAGVSYAAALGALVGACADLTMETPALLWTAVCAGGALAASLLRKRRRIWQAAAFCLCAAVIPLALDVDRPLAVLYQAAVGAAAYVLLPRQWLAALSAGADMPQAVPAMAGTTVSGARAEAFRALYDTMFRTRPVERGENPSVIFDHAAQQACRNCVLMKRCWQAEYQTTYNAFNDACGPMLKRGRAEAEDFPLFFASRCLHFPELLAAVNTELYAFRLRRQYRVRLEDARQLAEAQYEHLGQVLGEEPVQEPAGELLRCRVGTLLRPKEGESACGDQLAVFTAGNMLYMLLSDGMGSGAAAHAESAMTVRLLRQFLKAGIRPTSALKTINTALTLRCQEGGGFTTIDLLALDRRGGEATLYKYGAAASYVKRRGVVTALEGGSLPAGLQPARQPPEATRLHLEPGTVLVMVSDGVTGEGDDWLREQLRQWPGGDSQELAQLILAESRRHGGLRDDCAALVLRLEKSDEKREKRV